MVSPVGLMSKMNAAGTGDLVGNSTQAPSHLTHSNAAAPRALKTTCLRLVSSSRSAPTEATPLPVHRWRLPFWAQRPATAMTLGLSLLLPVGRVLDLLRRRLRADGTGLATDPGSGGAERSRNGRTGSSLAGSHLSVEGPHTTHQVRGWFS